MGREEEIAYAREHGIPIKGGDRGDAVLDRRQPLGPLVGGQVDRGPRRTRPTTTSSSSSPGPSDAPDEPETVTVELRARASRSRSTASALGLVELLERAAEIGCRHGVGIVDHIEDRIVGLKVRDIYEVPAAAIILPAHARAREARRHDPPEPLQGRRSTASGPTSSTPGSGGSRCARTSTPTWTSVNERVTGKIGAEALQGLGARRHARVARTRVYDAALATFETSRRPVQPAGLARASSSCGRCSRAWPTG